MKLNKKILSFLISTIFVTKILFAQVSGTIIDHNGSPLPYATILIKDTGIGVSANEEGYFKLSVPKTGSYTLMVSFVGYSSHTELLNYEGKNIDLEIQLQPSSMLVDEFIVLSSGEDPAYAIIRAAQAKRNFYLKESPGYSCDVYVKGLLRVDSFPTELFGISLDMEDELLDEREKTIYLSETKSNLYSDGGDEFKEVITASVVSGNDQGYSFNSAAELDVNLYKNTFELGRPIVSPIASNAMTYYRYRLLRTYTELNGEKIHEIKLTPKRSSDAAYSGKIYIVDGRWSIHASDLFISGRAAHSEGLDSLKLRQQYLRFDESDHSFVVSRQIVLYGGLMGFIFSGAFTGVYDSYQFKGDINAPLDKKEVLAFTEESMERNKIYFDSIRPIPLSTLEQEDYLFKDSLQQLETDPAHLDSMERKSNNFSLTDLVFGYTYNRRSKNIRLRVSSPIESIIFNPVQGRNLNLRTTFFKFKDSKELRGWYARVGLNYGLSDKKLRSKLEWAYDFNKITNDKLRIYGGVELKDYNNTESISPLVNSLYCLYRHENPLRFYEKTSLGLSYRRNVTSFLDLKFGLEWAERRSLANNSEFSYFRDDRSYLANTPTFLSRPFQNAVFTFSVNADLFLGRTYRSYPGRRVYNTSPFPSFKVAYTFLHYGQDQYAHKLSFGLADSDVSLGAYGTSNYNLKLGLSLGADQLHYIDYFHFAGNDIAINTEKQLREGFSLLPYYDYSSTNLHLRAKWNHDFNGFVMDKLPLLKKLGISMVVSAASLVEKDYTFTEFGIGIDRIGFGLFRVLRVDYVLGGFLGENFLDQRGIRLSFKL